VVAHLVESSLRLAGGHIGPPLQNNILCSGYASLGFSFDFSRLVSFLTRMGRGFSVP
jgi:hypothetical protein